jgi:ABC-type sugar transport system ATPase subunit
MGMSDRIYIMRKGVFCGELTRDEFKEERILAMAAGLEAQ